MKTTCYCQERLYKLLFTSKSFLIVRCLNCGQVRTITPKGALRKQVYTKENIQIYIEKETIFRKLFRQVLTFIKRYVKSGVFLEIGAGIGLLMDEARRMGFDVYGFEPSRIAVDIAKKKFHVLIKQKEFKRQQWQKKADVVVINHVLEHLPDPKVMISDIHKVLIPHGILVIGVPNFGCFLAKLKKSRWQSLIPDQHRWHFTLKSLDALVIPLKFKRIGITSENHDRSLHPWWKRPVYFLIDTLSQLVVNGEAILVAYQKNP